MTLPEILLKVVVLSLLVFFVSAVMGFTIHICILYFKLLLDIRKKCVFCGSRKTIVYSRESMEAGAILPDGTHRILLWKRSYRECCSCGQQQFIRKKCITAHSYPPESSFKSATNRST